MIEIGQIWYPVFYDYLDSDGDFIDDPYDCSYYLRIKEKSTTRENAWVLEITREWGGDFTDAGTFHHTEEDLMAGYRPLKKSNDFHEIKKGWPPRIDLDIKQKVFGRGQFGEWLHSTYGAAVTLIVTAILLSFIVVTVALSTGKTKGHREVVYENQAEIQQLKQEIKELKDAAKATNK